MRTEELRLEAHDRRVTGRQVGNRLEPDRAFDLDRQHQRAHRPGGRVVVDVDEIGLARSLQRPRHVEHPHVAASEWRIDLDGDDELALPEHASQLGLFLLLGQAHDHLVLREDERPGRRSVLGHRLGDGGDLRRGRAAAPADDSRAEAACVRGELGEVVRRRVWIDDPVAGHAREADVRHGRERETVAAHRVQRPERGLNPGAVVRADGGDVRLLEPVDRVACRHPRERLGLLVEREHGEDGERRDAPYRGDRALQLRQVEEGLDGEQVHAPSFEDFRLLGEDLRALFVETASSSP